VLVTTEERARELGGGEGVVRILGSGVARVEKAQMPRAPVPAAELALRDAVTTHNPFAVNDIWLSRCSGIPVEEMNACGSSLVYGHPQAPTGARAVAELIETLRLRGGGTGLFTGCAPPATRAERSSYGSRTELKSTGNASTLGPRIEQCWGHPTEKGVACATHESRC